MAHDTRSDLIGSHAFALMSVRARSLEAYGISPNTLMKYKESRELMWHSDHRELMIPDPVRALSRISKDTRALAVQEDHALMIP